MKTPKDGRSWIVLILMGAVGCAPAAPVRASTSIAHVTLARGRGGEFRRTSDGSVTLSLRGKGKGSSEAVDRIASAFVAEQANLLDLDASRLEIRQVRRSPFGNVVEMDEHAHGLPVFGSEVRVVVDGAGIVRHVTASTLRRDAQTSLPPRWASSVDAESAAVEAVRRLARLGEPRVIAVERGFERRTARVAFRCLVVDGEIPVALVVVRAEDSTVTDYRKLCHDAAIEGALFNPNPVNTLNDRSLADAGDSCASVPVAAYYWGSVQADDPVGGVYALSGPYVRIVDLAPPTGAVATTTSFDGFDFCRDESGFEEFNVYYWTTRSAEYVESLGHALLNSPIDIDAHSDVARAPFFVGLPYGYVPPTGIPAAFMMLTDTRGSNVVDAGEDADIVAHEHSHAVFHGLRPVAFCNRGEPDAINEGSADYWAASSFWNTSIANGFDPDCLGEWFEAGTGDGCTRRTVSTKVYPQDLDLVDFDPHADGEMWSSFLIDLSLAVNDFVVVDRLLLGAVELAPDAPSFYDMVEAMRDADFLLYGGSHDTDVVGLATSHGFNVQRAPEVSADLSGVPLFVRKAAAGQVTLLWQDLGASIATYNIYDGTIGHFADDDAPWTVFPAPACGIAGTPGPAGYRQFTGTPDAEDAFFLVTAVANAIEGPAGYYSKPTGCFEQDPRANTCPP